MTIQNTKLFTYKLIIALSIQHFLHMQSYNNDNWNSYTKRRVNNRSKGI